MHVVFRGFVKNIELEYLRMLFSVEMQHMPSQNVLGIFVSVVLCLYWLPVLNQYLIQMHFGLLVLLSTKLMF